MLLTSQLMAFLGHGLNALTSAGNKHGHVHCSATQHRADHEEKYEGEHDGLAPEALDEAADERERGGRRDGVCASGPYKVAPVQVFDDRRQCGRHRRLVMFPSVLAVEGGKGAH